MLATTLVVMTLSLQTQGDIQGVLMGRSLTWDPQGLVPFSIGHKLSDQDRGWIAAMREGEYAKASAAAKLQCLAKEPSFFAVWVVAESARVRKDLSDLGALSAGLKSAGVTAPYASYASYRLFSLKLAQTPSGEFRGSTFMQNPEYRPLVTKTHDAWEACRPFATKHLPIAVALATGREQPATIRDVVVKAVEASAEKEKLTLWKARALLLGRRSTPVDLKSGKPDRLPNGKVRTFFLEGDEPDLVGAAQSLKAFKSKYPNDPKYLYYHARLLSWQAFSAEKAADRTAKLNEATSNIEKFLVFGGQPLPLVDSAKKFLKYKDPAAFTTSPLE